MFLGKKLLQGIFDEQVYISNFLREYLMSTLIDI